MSWNAAYIAVNPTRVCGLRVLLLKVQKILKSGIQLGRRYDNARTFLKISFKIKQKLNKVCQEVGNVERDVNWIDWGGCTLKQFISQRWVQYLK